MEKLTLAHLADPESYRRMHRQVRQAMIAHKARRRLGLGPDVSLLFEDQSTIRYQVQEMIRIEGLRSPAEFEQELAVYNPLIPDGNNLKCTMLIEYPDAGLRRQALQQLVNMEQQLWLQIGDHTKVFARPIDDSGRVQTGHTGKTAAVHFLRFDFSPPMIAAAKARHAWRLGCDHAHYSHCVDPIPDHITAELVGDLD